VVADEFVGKALQEKELTQTQCIIFNLFHICTGQRQDWKEHKKDCKIPSDPKYVASVKLLNSLLCNEFNNEAFYTNLLQAGASCVSQITIIDVHECGLK